MSKRRIHRYPVNDRREYYRKTYLQSDHWAQLKSKKLEHCPFCAVCGRSDNLEVHHKRYKNLYDVNLGDLEVLCRRHHDLLHSGTAALAGYHKERAIEHRLSLMIELAKDFRKVEEPF